MDLYGASPHIELSSSGEVVAQLLWDAASACTVDLQAVVVDNRGRVIDAVCRSNARGCGARGVSHCECAAGRDELGVSLGELPAAVQMILLLACACPGRALQDSSASLVVRQACEAVTRSLLRSELRSCCGATRSGAVVVASLVRAPQSGRWRFYVLCDPLPAAGHFMDALSDLHRHVAAEVPTVPPLLQVSVSLGKGGVLELPLTQGSVMLGFGYGTEQSHKSDAHSAVIIVDDRGEVLEVVFGRARASSGPHSRPGAVSLLPAEGRTRSKDGALALIDFAALGPQVRDVFCFAGMPVKPQRSEQSTPCCRVLDAGSAELCRYIHGSRTSDLTPAGVVLGRLKRGAGGRWGFHALGASIDGSSFEDALPHMPALFEVEPRAWQELAETQALAAGAFAAGEGQSPCSCVVT